MENQAQWDAQRFIDILSEYKVKGETKSGFAKRMGFKSHKIFQDWRKGQKPRPESLLQIKQKLTISQEHFDEMTGVAYGVIFKKWDNKLNQMKTSEITSALRRAKNPLIERVLALIPETETLTRFLQRIEVDSDDWENWLEIEMENIGSLNFSQLMVKLAEHLGPDKRTEIEEIMEWFEKNRSISGKKPLVNGGKSGNKRGVSKVSNFKRRSA